MSIEIKEVPKEFHFKKGEIVEVKGKLRSGIGKIDFALYPVEQLHGELAYCFRYNEPFPQIGIIFEDGNGVHYNADDLIAGKIKRTDKKMQESDTLINFLNKIKIDSSIAARELGLIDDEDNDDDENIESLFDSCDKIIKFIEPLFNERVFCNININEITYLGEFDSCTFEFKSISIGKAIRNSSLPAFLLKITVDEYAPTTMSLSISEVYYWRN